MELSAIMLQLEVREKELMKYVNKTLYHSMVLLISLLCCSFPHSQASLAIFIPFPPSQRHCQ